MKLERQKISRTEADQLNPKKSHSGSDQHFVAERATGCRDESVVRQ